MHKKIITGLMLNSWVFQPYLFALGSVQYVVNLRNTDLNENITFKNIFNQVKVLQLIAN